MGTELQFCKMKRVLETDGRDGHTTVWMNLMQLNCTPKVVRMVNFMSGVFYHNFKKFNFETFNAYST